MNRIAVVFALVLTGCVLDDPTAGEITDEELAQVEQEAATPPTITELVPSEHVTISGAPNSVRYFKLEVATAMDHVTINRDGPLHVGADVFVKRGSIPSTTSYDCRRLNGASGACRIDYAQPGTYYVTVIGRDSWNNGYVDMELWGYASNTYLPISNNSSRQIYNQYGNDYFYKLAVPSGTASVSFTFTLDPEDDGSFDLVVKRGAFATASVYDCKKVIDWYQWTETGTCTIYNPPAGTYYVGLIGDHYKVVGTFSARYRWPITNTTTVNYDNVAN